MLVSGVEPVAFCHFCQAFSEVCKSPSCQAMLNVFRVRNNFSHCLIVICGTSFDGSVYGLLSIPFARKYVCFAEKAPEGEFDGHTFTCDWEVTS